MFSSLRVPHNTIFLTNMNRRKKTHFVFVNGAIYHDEFILGYDLMLNNENRVCVIK